MTSYATWLRNQGERLYRAAGIEWRAYHGALVPVYDVPVTVAAHPAQLRPLLRQSGTWLARYPGRLLPTADSLPPSAVRAPLPAPCTLHLAPCFSSCSPRRPRSERGSPFGNPESGPGLPGQPRTPGVRRPAWYYILCDQLLPIEALTKKARYELRHGLKTCAIRRITADWLATHGHECYQAAHTRYRHSRPLPATEFARQLHARADTPFEHWGAFVGNTLAAYSTTITAGHWAMHSVAKYHPAFLQARTAYALVRALTEEYVGTRGLVLVNGTRSVSHDTNYSHLLERLGFVHRGCELKVVYRPVLEALLNVAWPLRRALARLPDFGPLHEIRAALMLEGRRRTSALTGCPA
jgi:hypothetical protein